MRPPITFGYRKSLEPAESEAIRTLRRRGFAVAFVRVSDPMNRAAVERAMLAAGKQQT